jgi:hypothetical protein
MTLAVLDRPTQATSTLTDHPLLLGEPPTTVLTSQSLGIQVPAWTSTDLPSAMPRSDVVTGTTRTLGVEERDRLFTGLLLWLAVVWLLPRRKPMIESAALEPAEAVERLRHWTGLSVGGVADLLGVTRRSLYHWKTGTTRPRHEDRLVGLVRAIQAAARSWQPWELRQWLAAQDARELVRAGDMASLRRLLDDAVRPSAVRRLRPVRAGYHEDVEALDAVALRDHFTATVAPRPITIARAAAPFVPRELTDSPLPEEE